MMISGVGVDHVEIEDFSGLADGDNPGFLRRIFSPVEIAAGEQRNDRIQYFAARFAVKEALLKALGTGWTDDFDWQQIEVTADPSGAPIVRLSGNLLALAEAIPVRKIHVSLSHTSHLALAQVILETEDAEVSARTHKRSGN